MKLGLLSLLLVILSVAFTHGYSVGPYGSHNLERREVGGFSEILTELKGKGMGGRMRFGKRSAAVPNSYREVMPVAYAFEY